MDGLADRSLGQLLEDVAAESPAPGGGSSCALACAMAAGLAEMAAAFTLARAEHAERHERMAALRARAGHLRAEALALAEQELHAYEPVLEALRRPPDEPGRAGRLDAALSEAADSPLAVARAAAEVATLAAEAARSGNPHLRGDAVAGALLAEAACVAATRLAELNLARRPDDPRRAEAAELAGRAGRARVAALALGDDV
ncbi:MAG TPA: cyclodeaminase/cyclohydrolase family protein [Solirubrobacteraceae bacterium]